MEKIKNIKKEVYKDLESYNTKKEKINYLKDVVNYGCINGVVTNLIYYADTLAFYDAHEEEINNLIDKYRKDIGYSRLEFINSLNGNVEDIKEEKNLLAWFSYEEICREILINDFKEDF